MKGVSSNILAILIFLAVTLMPSSAKAALIQYDFLAAFSSDTSVDGQFWFNTETEEFSNIAVNLNSTTWEKITFDYDSFSNYRTLALLNSNQGPDYLGDPLLHIWIDGGMSWGELSYDNMVIDLGRCSRSDCEGRFIKEIANEYSLTGTIIAVNESSSLALLILGILFVAVARINNKKVK